MASWRRGVDGRVNLDPGIAAIRQAGAVDAIILQEVVRSFPGLPGHASYCDFFFVSADLGPRLRALEVLADTDASDHRPLVLEVDAGESS